jgi:hypothetical protein
MRLKYAVAALFAVLLIVTATAWVTAQAFAVDRVTPKVLVGPDVGFRVEGIRAGKTPVGKVVVKVNGEWVEAEIAGETLRSVRP